MKCPTVEQVQAAANKSKFIKDVLEELFPEAFESPIKAGQIYSWGTASDGGSGLVIDNPVGSGLALINFHKGWVYLPWLPTDCTKRQLNNELRKLDPDVLHRCYQGRIEGPKHFKSWCMK